MHWVTSASGPEPASNTIVRFATTILADVAVRSSELGERPFAPTHIGHACHRRVIDFRVPAELYQQMMECLDDFELADCKSARE